MTQKGKKTSLLSHPPERACHENPAKSRDSVTGPFNKFRFF